MKTQRFVLMFDKRGWSPLVRQNLGLDYDYLRERSSLPEVDVPKGSIVVAETDTLGGISVTATCQDLFENQEHAFQPIKLVCLIKEILPIDEVTYNVLKTASPKDRYRIMTERNKYPIIGAAVGDTVRVSRGPSSGESIGVIRYIGPLEGDSEDAIWYGVEFIDGTYGSCNGTLGQRRYFKSEPFRTRFFSADKLSLYDPKNYMDDPNKPVNDFSTLEDEVNDEKNENFNSPNAQLLSTIPFKGHFSSTCPETTRVKSYERATMVQQLLRDVSPPENTSQPDVNINNLKQIDQEETLQLGDRLVWHSENYGPQYGTVRWIGIGSSKKSDRDIMVGLELDCDVGSGNGVFEGKTYFSTRKNCAEFVPLSCLMKADDFASGIRNLEVLNNNCESFQTIKRESNFCDLQPLIPVGTKEKNVESRLMFSRHYQRQNQRDEKHNKKLNDNLKQNHIRTLNGMPCSDQFKLRKSDPKAQESAPTYENESNRENELNSNAVDQFILPEFDRVHSDMDKNKQVEIGTLVELYLNGEPLYGVIQWIGNLPPPDHHVKTAGIELESELEGAGNGWHNGTLYFTCPSNKGVFVPLTHFQRDKRFEPHCSTSKLGAQCSTLSSPTLFGDLDCPIVTGSYPPISMTDVGLLLGRNKGIQGHQNSCYLDATLFAMFSFTCVFDCLLFRPPTSFDIFEYPEVQRVLREEIVNPLRKNFFVRADRVMKLRQLLNKLTSVKGLTTEEKDPEEFLNSLLSQTLRASPFLELSSGQTSHLYQLFVMRDESRRMPSVQDLFEQSFLNSGIKLSKIPSVLILQMPRFGNQYKVYDRILPSMFLDVTDIIEGSPRQCIICSKLASYECSECYGDHSRGLDGIVFCEFCLDRQHNRESLKKHKWKKLTLSNEFFLHGFHSTSNSASRLFMELFAVVCIETSHYVSFVKSGTGPDASWCFFDSMADRKGEQHGYNIPEVTAAPHVSNWLTDEGVMFLNNIEDEKLLPEQAKRLFCDAYMCFYQSTDIMMYQ